MMTEGNMQDKTTTTATTNSADLDSVLLLLGNIGWYQIRVYILSCLPVFIAGAVTTSLIFTTAVPDHRCLVGGCDVTSSIPIESNRAHWNYNESFLSYTIPKKSQINPKTLAISYESCSMYAHRSNQYECDAKSFSNETIVACDSNYVFDRRHFNSTVVVDFGLICSYSWVVQVLQSFFFLGILLGSIINGYVGDKYGRRIIFIFMPSIMLLSLFISALSSNVLIYGFCLLLKGVCVAGIYQSAFVVGIEFLGGRWRFWLGNFHSIVFALGGIYSCIMASIFRTWRLVEISNTFPVMLMLSFPCVFPESIRWKISNRRVNSAIRQINKAARVNSVNIDRKLFDSLITLYSISQDGNNDEEVTISRRQEGNVTILDIFKHRIICRWTMSLLYIWFTNSLVYYGLSFLASEIDEDVYYSMVLLSMSEIPGILLTSLAVERFNRRSVLMFVLVFGGFSCTFSSLLSDNYANIRTGLIIIGKAAISGSFSLIYVYTVEIFPTVLRISGLGLCSVFSRVGGISAPYILKLEIFGSYFPFFAIGVASLLGGFSSAILPETKNKKLPDTLEDVACLEDRPSPSSSTISNRRLKYNFLLSNKEESANLLENESA